MRVNSYFTCFFARLVVVSGFAIVILAVFFIGSAFKEGPDPDLAATRVNLLIRQIGDRLLRQAGDSTSRVLPVTKIKDGTFLLKFENEFVFNHDSLMVLSKSILPKSQYRNGYTVTVLDCSNGDIVYGFEVNNTLPDILPCSGRSQPPGCYSIQFAFRDFYESVKQEKAAIGFPSESIKSDPPQSVTLATVPSGQRPPLINLVLIGILLTLGVILFIWRFRKMLTPKPMQNQNNSLIKEFIPESAALGKFLFNKKGQRLLLGTEVIMLTDKECKVLELLYKNFGELTPRGTLMQEVWINEGVITGRSLDMFVSKLRKKLSRDPGLSITNVHGKGYMLETPAI